MLGARCRIPGESCGCRQEQQQEEEWWWWWPLARPVTPRPRHRSSCSPTPPAVAPWLHHPCSSIVLGRALGSRSSKYKMSKMKWMVCPRPRVCKVNIKICAEPNLCAQICSRCIYLRQTSPNPICIKKFNFRPRGKGFSVQGYPPSCLVEA